MKVFPDVLHVSHKDNFGALHYERSLCYLRKCIYEHMIREDENSYFEIDRFCEKYVKDTDKTEKMVLTVIQELQKLGWNCKISFGGTGLFIYSSEKPPVNCWNGDF